MSVSKVFLSLLSLGTVVISCVKDPDASQYHSPQILDTGMRINESDVTLSCKVSRNDNIEKCGFLFGTKESLMKEYDAELPETDEFSFNMPGLTFGVKYYYRSFVSGGRDSRMSDIKTLEIDQRLPAVNITSLKVDGTFVVCEYSVSGNFSGDLYFRGLCWNEEGSPDIKLETKTLDGTEYGSRSVSLDDFEIGKTYYFRAYAGNAKGINYSEEVKVVIPILFDDQTLYDYLLGRYDEDSDGVINLKEAAKVTTIDIVSDKLFSLKGLEYTPNLDTLRCRGVSRGSGGLTGVDLKLVPELSMLDLSNNKISSLDLSPLKRLQSLYLAGNLSLGKETLTSGLPFLPTLHLLDISGCPCLDPDFAIFPALEELRYDSLTGISSSESMFRNLRTLRRLYAGDGLKTDDKFYLISGLELLDCAGSQVTTLDVSYNRSLKSLNVNDCKQLGELDVCASSSLTELSCLGSGIRTLYMLEGQKINGVNENVDKHRTVPESTKIVYAPRITDAAFSNYLIDFFDTDNNSFVSMKEAAAVTEMTINPATYSGITSLYGIGMFTSLKVLRVSDQPKLTKLDLSANHDLTELQCDNVPLRTLDLDGCLFLKTLFAQSTALTSLSLSSLVEVAYISWSASLKTLDLSASTSLKTLVCDNCAFETLDIRNCPSLKNLDCTSSALKTLYLTKAQKEKLSLTCSDATQLVVY